ncbi:MAG: hypothetical protein IKG87_06995 [Clostridia bacterium]|nr:hypothetical protein [Clostridia bacterium]
MKRMYVLLLAVVLFILPGIALANNQYIPQLVSMNDRTYTISLDVPNLQTEYPVNFEDSKEDSSEYWWSCSLIS